MKNKLFLILALIIKSSLIAQTTDFCSLENLIIEDRIFDQINPYNTPIDYRTEEPLCLRTVVHVITNNNQEVVSDSIVEDLIYRLNLLLTTEEVDTSLVHVDHRNLLVNAELQFHLAQFDPEGIPTNGITRTFSDIQFFSGPILQDSFFIEQVKEDSLGGKSAWDTEKYFNIWIAPMKDSLTNYNYGIPNSNFFPLGTSGIVPAGIPGAVIDLDFILNASTPNILSHEIGHALGLFHPWGWPPNRCEIDDYMDDTPTSKIAGLSCSETTNTCIDSIGDRVDNKSNIMGNSCMLMFTPNQIATIKNNVFNYFQGGIIENEGCGLFTSTSNLSEELDEDFTLQVYPNPNNGFFFVEFTQQETADVTFNFYDPLGKLINSETIINTKLILKEFNLPTLQNGVIIMNIKSKNINISRKVIIQN